MRYMRFEHNGKTYERISRRKAEQAFNEGVVVICPCNMKPFGMWGMGVHITSCGRSFESIVNEFEVLNCNNETGRYAAFYKEV